MHTAVKGNVIGSGATLSEFMPYISLQDKEARPLACRRLGKAWLGPL